MKQETIAKLDELFSEHPVMKATEVPTDTEIDNAAAVLDVSFHDDFCLILRRYGGAMVGSLPIYGLRPVKVMGARWSIVEVTKFFRTQGWPNVTSWYVISEDGFGNPIGVSPRGQVLKFDHDVGKETVVAADIEQFILNHCLK